MSEDSDKKVIAHLGFIETTITRMGQNSFHAKTWSITIIAALLAFNFTQNGNPNVASDKMFIILSGIIALAAVLPFAVIDAYYLHLERGYRDLYKEVAKSSEYAKDYGMDRPKYAKGFKRFWSALWSRSVIPLYLVLTFFYLILVLINRKLIYGI